MAEQVEIPEELQYRADNLREKLDQDFPTRRIMAEQVAEGLEEDLDAIRIDTFIQDVRLTTTETKLTVIEPQVASTAASVAALTAAVAALGIAVAKAQSAADKAQATADSKPGGEGSGGYTLVVKWTTPSGSGVTGPINTSVSAGGRNISKQLTSAQSSSLSGLTSGSVVTFAVDIGPDNTVQWKDESNQDNPNLTGRSNFYKTYSGFKVPATTGTKTIIADIG
jgi:hypothetical protein